MQKLKKLYNEIFRWVLNAQRFVVAVILLFITLPICWMINYDKLAKFIKNGSSSIWLIASFGFMFSDIFYTYPLKTFYLFMLCLFIWSKHVGYPAIKASEE